MESVPYPLSENPGNLAHGMPPKFNRRCKLTLRGGEKRGDSDIPVESLPLCTRGAISKKPLYRNVYRLASHASLREQGFLYISSRKPRSVPMSLEALGEYKIEWECIDVTFGSHHHAQANRDPGCFKYNEWGASMSTNHE